MQTTKAKMSLVIRLPFPDPLLFPNRKNGRGYKATLTAKQRQRDDAYILTLAAKRASDFSVEPGAKIPLSIVFVEPSNHHRDLDGCLSAAKSQIDGMAKALGVDDNVFQPVMLDRGGVGAPGAMICAVGVQIQSAVSL